MPFRLESGVSGTPPRLKNSAVDGPPQQTRSILSDLGINLREAEAHLAVEQLRSELTFIAPRVLEGRSREGSRVTPDVARLGDLCARTPPKST